MTSTATPAVSKISSLEAQRVSAIVDETLEKLTFLGSITPDVLQHRDELSQIVGDEISRIIQEQRRLEEKYETLIAQRSSLKGLANKSKFKENQREIQAVSRALRESTKNLCRNLKNNPNIGGNLLKIQNERQSLIDLLSRTLDELKQGSFDTLVNRVAEDKQTQTRIQDVFRREKEVTEAVKQLNHELSQSKLEHQREVAEQTANIAQLKEQLLQLKSKTQIDITYARKEAKAKASSTSRMYNQMVVDQEKKIEGYQQQYETEVRVHEETIAFLERKQESLMEECSQWSEKYQLECEEKEKELQACMKERNANLSQLEKLQARWDETQALHQAKLEEQKRLKDLEELRKEEERQQHKAASVIQSRFRKYMEKQQALRQKNASEKKAKGKGKGKKGKKK